MNATNGNSMMNFSPYRLGGGYICRLFAGFLCLSAALSADATTWSYSAGTEAPNTIGTITDGQWTIKVSKFDKETGTLAFASTWGKCMVKAWQEPSDPSKNGILDLRSPLVVVEDGGKTQIQSVEIGESAFACGWSSITSVVAFYCDIVGSMGASCFAANANMVRIEVGGSAESMPGLVLSGCGSLKVARFDFPELRSVGNKNSQSLFGNTSMTALDPVDVATVACPGVTNVFGWALANSVWCGDLALTNVMALGNAAFNNASLTNVSLSGALDTLNSMVFGGNTITNVVLDLPQLGTIAADAFKSQSNIRRVELVTALSDMGIVSNIVSSAANGAQLGDNGYQLYWDQEQWKWVYGENDLRIYVSKQQWTPSESETYSADNPTGFFLGKETFTDKEKEMIAADPTLAKAFGVLVVNGVRRAFFVNKRSIHDPKGLYIRIR